MTAHAFLTTPAEIKGVIKQPPSLKAPGPDGIQNIILKNLPSKAILQLMYLHIQRSDKAPAFPDAMETCSADTSIKTQERSIRGR